MTGRVRAGIGWGIVATISMSTFHLLAKWLGLFPVWPPTPGAVVKRVLGNGFVASSSHRVGHWISFGIRRVLGRGPVGHDQAHNRVEGHRARSFSVAHHAAGCFSLSRLVSLCDWAELQDRGCSANRTPCSRHCARPTGRAKHRAGSGPRNVLIAAE